jgi:formiminotetrahydrofolate cyclodeaminase
MSQIKETLLDDQNLVAYDAYNLYNRADDYVREFVEHHRAKAQKDFTDSGHVYASLTGALTAELARQLGNLYLLQENYADLERRYQEAVEKQWEIRDKYVGQVDDVIREHRSREAMQRAQQFNAIVEAAGSVQ